MLIFEDESLCLRCGRCCLNGQCRHYDKELKVCDIYHLDYKERALLMPSGVICTGVWGFKIRGSVPRGCGYGQ